MRRKKIWIPILLGLIICFYLLMLHSTDSVINDFKACICCAPEAQELQSSALYRRYYYDYGGSVVDANISIKRIFVCHNFKKGFMYVIYTCKKFDASGKFIAGSSDVTSTWFIEKQNGKWVVTAVREAP